MKTIWLVIMLLIAFKAVTVGSDFNFYHYFKYEKKYSEWYFNKETFKSHLKKDIKNDPKSKSL